jgi:2-polyprenyl-3-methyl-5-hydroxy-6-metoxy-1,4-benzoquinol methylase
MRTTIQQDVCPVCGSSHFKEVCKTKDFGFSGDSFVIMECTSCALRFTQNVPDAESSEYYYQSEKYVSHTENKKGFINYCYHKVRKLTLKLKSRFIIQTTEKIVGHHLDIGAGTGSFVNEMERSGWNSIGIEPSAKARKIANKKYNASVYPMAELNNLTDDSYTAITMWHVLEHVYDLQTSVDKIQRILDRDGMLFIAVPNYKSFDSTFYKEYWAAYDVPRHLYHFAPSSMKLLLEKHGLILVKTRRMWFDSFYVSLLSEKYKKGNMIRGLIVGLISNIIALFNKEKCSSLVYVAKKFREVED